MTKPTTIYQVILDKSGSMSDSIDNSISGFNEQIHKIRSTAMEFPDQDIRIGLTVFNDHVENLYFNRPPEQVPFLTPENYVPSGFTALLDAIGQTCTKIEKSIDASNQAANTTVVVVIITDGHENASTEYTLQEIRRMIERLESRGKWTFSFIGATLDAVDTAARMSIKRQNSYSYDKEHMRTEVWDTLSGSLASYMKKKSKGEQLDNLFED